jgi:hypothetical protein
LNQRLRGFARLIEHPLIERLALSGEPLGRSTITSPERIGRTSETGVSGVSQANRSGSTVHVLLVGNSARLDSWQQGRWA